MDTVATTLAWLGDTAFRWSAVAFILINAVAAAAFFITKDRSIVNQWTSKLVFADVLLLGTGVGIPVLTKAATFVVEAAGATTGHTVKVKLDK